MSILWRLIAFIVSRRPIARWLIWHAQCTPYFHLTGYMNRWWLFNPYAGSSSSEATAAGDRARHSARRWSWLPSIRVHHILRADTADHPHDHPWDARTIILEGGYFERRHAGAPRIMRRGDTAAIRHGDFHHIEHVSPGGVWTLFITWDYQGSWGFLVNGVKVPWRVYEAEHQRHEAAPRHGVTAQHARPVVALATCKHPDDERITVMSGSSWCGECGTRVAYDGGRPASPSQTAGRWRVGRAGCEIAHSDFGADVVLALSGDFATAQEREQFAQAVADRLNAAPAEAQPGEWVLVPREPTQAMLDAGHWPCVQGRGAKSVWATMLAAAPQQASAPVGVEAREIAEHDHFAAIVNALHGAGESMERSVVLARVRDDG